MSVVRLEDARRVISAAEKKASDESGSKDDPNTRSNMKPND
jgi:hypothetical protein